MDRIQEIKKKIESEEMLSDEEINHYISVAQNDPEKLYELCNLYYCLLSKPLCCHHYH